MNYWKNYLMVLLLSLPMLVPAQGKQEKKVTAVVIGFYNLENLFDTINEPGIRDGEFTPEGSKLWNTERYWHKQKHMARVISEMGTEYNPDGVAVLGISEVENRNVVEDLINQPALKDRNYQIIHYDSPDHRGIDVAMIYNPKYFKPYRTSSHRLHIPQLKDFATRDQLLVDGVLVGGDTIHVIVNHWPSRYGGEKRSRWLRNAAADLSRKIADSLLAEDPNARIIMMGDLNDDPVNESVLVHFGAKGKASKVRDGEFFNPMYAFYKKGLGSLAYRDSWNMFDQIIISKALLGNDYSHYKFFKAKIFRKPYLLNKEGRFKGYPYRTFVGNTFQGGYSDHLPVYIVLVKEI
jgi:hypothetical protein